MICGLFSIFDPVCSFPIFGQGSFKWFFVVPVILFVPYQVSTLPVGETLLKNAVFLSFINNLLPSSLWKESVIFASIFVIIYGVNVSSLSPLCYAPSAHPGFVLPLSLSLFLPSVIGWLVSNGGRSFSAHHLPTGSPPALWGFLVLVETVSLWIRPITLSIRLVANIMAGHIFIEMLANLMIGFPSSLPFGVLIFTGLIGFEMAVSLVQALVFTNLLVMFWAEQGSAH